MSGGYWVGEHYFDGRSDVASQCVDPYGRVHFIEERDAMHTEARTEEIPAVPMDLMVNAANIARGLYLGAFVDQRWYDAEEPALWDEVRRILRSKGFDMFARTDREFGPGYRVEVRA